MNLNLPERAFSKTDYVVLKAVSEEEHGLLKDKNGITVINGTKYSLKLT